MGLTDKLKDLTKKAEDTAAEHKDQIREAAQKAGAAADQRSGGRYHEQIQKASTKMDALVDRLNDPAESPADEQATTGETPPAVG